MAGTSEDVMVRMKKNVFSWFGHVERICDERMAKKIYDGKVSGKRDRGRPRLTFENIVPKILEEGHVKSMRTPRRVCMKRWTRRKRYVETVAFGALFSLTTTARDKT